MPSPIDIRPTTFNPGLVSTISNTTLTNFPFAFIGTYSWLKSVANGGVVQNASGFDIYFSSDSAGQNIIPFERVVWNPTTGGVEFYGLLASISQSSLPTIYVCSGDAGITSDLSQKTLVWDSNFMLVLHCGDGSSLVLTDSTSNGNNGTNHGAVATGGQLAFGTNLSAEHGGAILFDGTDDYVSIPDSTSLNLLTPITIENIQNPVSQSTSMGMLVKLTGAPVNGYSLIDIESLTPPAALPSLQVYHAGSLQQSPVGASIADSAGVATYDSSWYNTTQGVTWSFCGSEPRENGGQTWTSPAIGSSSGQNLIIGAFQEGAGVLSLFFNGILDEIRVSNIIRSQDWMNTTCNTLQNPGSSGSPTGHSPQWFYGIGSPLLVLYCANPPEGEVGISYTHALRVGGGVPPYTFAVIVGSLPPGLTLNTSTGVISGTPTTPGTYPFTVDVTDSALNGFAVACSITIVGNVSIICNNPPQGEVGVPYSHAFPASGGLPPYTWSITSGSLPTGLSLNTSTGVVSGTPTAVGTFAFTIQVEDSLSDTASVSCSITITGIVALCNNPPQGTVGVAYTASLGVVGGFPPYTWAITAGSLPPGLTLNTSTGVISGTPTTVGTYPFTFTVTDSLGSPASADCVIVIVAVPTPLTATCGSMPIGTVGVPLSFQIPISGGVPPYTVTLISGSLPPGLTINSSGLITGTPTSPGWFSFQLLISDAITSNTVVITCGILARCGS